MTADQVLNRFKRIMEPWAKDVSDEDLWDMICELAIKEFDRNGKPWKFKGGR